MLPPEIRIKIVFAQAQAVAQEEEEVLDANVSCRLATAQERPKTTCFSRERSPNRRFTRVRWLSPVQQ